MQSGCDDMLCQPVSIESSEISNIPFMHLSNVIDFFQYKVIIRDDTSKSHHKSKLVRGISRNTLE